MATTVSMAAVRSTAAVTSARRLPGSAKVISSGRMPVRARLSAHPTLATTSSCSLASATMWHWGLPWIFSPGSASDSTIIWRPLTRRSTTSGVVAASATGP